MKSKYMDVHPYKWHYTNHINPTGLFNQSQGTRSVFTLPSPEQNSKYLAPVKLHKEERKKILLCWLPSTSVPEQYSPSISLTLAHKASHGERREINSSQLVLSCNALFSRTGSCSLSGHKWRVNSYPANFQMDSIQSDLLAFNFPKWTHSGLGKWDGCPYTYR